MPAAPTMPPVSTTALYCAVQFGKTLLWVAADLVAFYVLGVVEHVPAGAVAMILMGSLAWHAVSDVLVGHWLEQRRGDRRSLALVTGAAVPVASAAFVLALLMAASRPWAALAMMMACRTAYSLFDVPHLALIGRMGANLFVDLLLQAPPSQKLEPPTQGGPYPIWLTPVSVSAGSSASGR